MIPPPGSAPDESRVPWSRIVLPAEHGGWSLTAEPALLGLLVAWSPAGLALLLAALLAFLVRTPARIVLVDCWRGRWLARSSAASVVVALEALLLAAALAVAWAQAVDGTFWVPLACAAPLFLVELSYDMRSRGRRLVPEVAGATGMSALAAAVALAGGASAGVAAGLTVLLASRSAASVPFVRARVARFRGHDEGVRGSDAAQVAALAATAAGWWWGEVPLAALVGLAAISVSNVVAVRRAPRQIVEVGIQQVSYGIILVVVTAVAARG